MEKVPSCDGRGARAINTVGFGGISPRRKAPTIRGRALRDVGSPGPLAALALQPTYGDNWAPWCPGDTRAFTLSWACAACHALFDLEFPSLVFYAFYSSPKWSSLLQYSSSQKYVSMVVEQR